VRTPLLIVNVQAAFGKSRPAGAITALENPIVSSNTQPLHSNTRPSQVIDGGISGPSISSIIADWVGTAIAITIVFKSEFPEIEPDFL
jgi:hypothetical protein